MKNSTSEHARLQRRFVLGGSLMVACFIVGRSLPLTAAGPSAGLLGKGGDHAGTVGGARDNRSDNPDDEHALRSPPRRLTDGLMMCKPLGASWSG